MQLRRADLPHDLEEVLAAWCQAPSTHLIMGDWRRAGYRRGARRPPHTGPTVEARRLGVRPDEPTDVSDRLQAALDQLGESGGGTLQLDAGRYLLERALFLHDSNTVLRGAGKEATTLYFPRPLAESVHPGTF
jgi:hypothetical protein